MDFAFRLSSFDWLNNGHKSHKGPRVFKKLTNIFWRWRYGGLILQDLDPGFQEAWYPGVLGGRFVSSLPCCPSVGSPPAPPPKSARVPATYPPGLDVAAGAWFLFREQKTGGTKHGHPLSGRGPKSQKIRSGGFRAEEEEERGYQQWRSTLFRQKSKFKWAWRFSIARNEGKRCKNFSDFYDWFSVCSQNREG